MNLYCVRHGEALSGEQDAQRALTEQGRIDVSMVAHYLGHQGVNIAHIISSAKQRAKQTAEIFANILNIEQISQSDLLLGTDSSIDSVMEMINNCSEDTMLVGHLPMISQLVSQLILGDPENSSIVNFFPGTVVCMERHDHHQWIINWVMNPGIIND